MDVDVAEPDRLFQASINRIADASKEVIKCVGVEVFSVDHFPISNSTNQATGNPLYLRFP